jgi:hypothetical protein
MMLIGDFADRLCRDIVHSVGRRDDRSFVVTTFRYPDGDLIALYAEGRGEDSYLTDKGTTLFKCTVSRIQMNEARQDLVDSVCRRYGVTLRDGELRKALRMQSFGLDCLRFCEAMTRISNLQFDADARSRSAFTEQVAALLERRVAPVRPILRRWTNPQLDPQGDYPIDFCVGDGNEARNVFAVGSAGKSTLVSAVSSFLKLHGAYVPTLSLVDPEIKLGTHHLNRLQRASTEIRFGVIGNEQDIVQFALAG